VYVHPCQLGKPGGVNVDDVPPGRDNSTVTRLSTVASVEMWMNSPVSYAVRFPRPAGRNPSYPHNPHYYW